jgi:hypothetical protein
MARAPAPSSARTAPPERASEPAAKPTPEAEPKPKPRSQPQPKPEASPEVVAPSFSVVRTVWHPKPERRVAQLSSADGSKVEVREGEAYEGLVVEEIQLSSVVFREGDVTFSRRVSARR